MEMPCPEEARNEAWQPSVTRLLEWYEYTAAILAGQAQQVSSGSGQSFDRNVGAEVDHPFDEFPHYPPDWIPRIDLLREFFEQTCRPVIDDDTQRRSVFHRALHKLGYRH